MEYTLHMASQISGKKLYAQKLSRYLNVEKPVIDVRYVKEYNRAIMHTQNMNQANY